MFTYTNNTTISHKFTQFLDKEKVVFVYLPDCRIIKQDAFYGFKNLQAVCAPNVRGIQRNAFQYCSKLSSVWVPKCEMIGDYAFDECFMLSQIEVADNIICNYLTQPINLHIITHTINPTIYVQLKQDKTTLDIHCTSFDSISGMLKAIQYDEVYVNNKGNECVKIFGLNALDVLTEGDIETIADSEICRLTQIKSEYQTCINTQLIHSFTTDQTEVRTHEYRCVKCLEAPKCTKMEIDLTGPSELQIILAPSLEYLAIRVNKGSAKECLQRLPKFDCKMLKKVEITCRRKNGCRAGHIYTLQRHNPYLDRLLRAGIFYNELASNDCEQDEMDVLGVCSSDSDAEITATVSEQVSKGGIPITIACALTLTPENMYEMAIEAAENKTETQWKRIIQVAREKGLNRFVRLVDAMSTDVMRY